MPKAEARVRSERASRYLVQMCKHFRHKVEAEWTDDTGRVDFAPGFCHMRVENGELIMLCEGNDERELGRAKYIVEDHLVRFGWREDIHVTWETPADDTLP
jgi:hypothetical protein